jgi:hypothetical protein
VAVEEAGGEELAVAVVGEADEIAAAGGEEPRGQRLLEPSLVDIDVAGDGSEVGVGALAAAIELGQLDHRRRRAAAAQTDLCTSAQDSRGRNALRDRQPLLGRQGADTAGLNTAWILLATELAAAVPIQLRRARRQGAVARVALEQEAQRQRHSRQRRGGAFDGRGDERLAIDARDRGGGDHVSAGQRLQLVLMRLAEEQCQPIGQRRRPVGRATGDAEAQSLAW